MAAEAREASPSVPSAGTGSEKPAAVVHLDLDGARHIYRAHGWSWERTDDPLFETGLLSALDFFAGAEVRATLFAIGEDLDDPRKRELLQEATGHGHEIASHSHTHRKLTALARDEKRREIFDSRERLSQVLGVEVRGFRAPGFAIDRESLELLDEAGYAWDSSVFPTGKFAQRIGVASVAQVPHRPIRERTLVELPLPAYRPLPTPFHASYSLVLGTWYLRAGLRSVRKTGAPLVMLFHLTDFADPLPKDHLSSWQAAFFTLSHIPGERKRRRCRRMLELARRDYEFGETRAYCSAVHRRT